MLFAKDSDGNRVAAKPGATGECPGCNGALVPRCGELVSWHWAHRAGPDCDPWSEGESEWHRSWKRSVYPDCCEVQMGPHRADIVTGSTVTELQHSQISPMEIRERERFYGRMVWIFNAAPFIRNLNFRPRDGFVSFRWKWPRKSLGAVTKPMYWDLGNGFSLEVRRLDVMTPSGGWGNLVTSLSLANKLFGESCVEPVYISGLERSVDCKELVRSAASSSGFRADCGRWFSGSESLGAHMRHAASTSLGGLFVQPGGGE